MNLYQKRQSRIMNIFHNIHLIIRYIALIEQSDLSMQISFAISPTSRHQLITHFISLSPIALNRILFYIPVLSQNRNCKFFLYFTHTWKSTVDNSLLLFFFLLICIFRRKIKYSNIFDLYIQNKNSLRPFRKSIKECLIILFFWNAAGCANKSS